MTEECTYALGLDVGGTKILGGLICLETGEVLARPRAAHRSQSRWRSRAV